MQQFRVPRPVKDRDSLIINSALGRYSTNHITARSKGGIPACPPTPGAGQLGFCRRVVVPNFTWVKAGRVGSTGPPVREGCRRRPPGKVGSNLPPGTPLETTPVEQKTLLGHSQRAPKMAVARQGSSKAALLAARWTQLSGRRSVAPLSHGRPRGLNSPGRDPNGAVV